MKKLITIAAIIASVLAGEAQTNAPLPSVSATNVPLSTNIFNDLLNLPQSLETLVTQGVNLNDTLWNSNSFTFWEAACFANVHGVAGESSQGNDLGLEVPIHQWNMHVDSVTRFEQLMGDIGNQQFGAAYDLIYYNILFSGGCDARYSFVDHHLRPVIFAEDDIATGKYIGLITRFSVVPGNRTALEGDVGMAFRLGKKW
jgi:hypothetical protein